MARLDTLFDGIVQGAKKIASTASEKTAEVMETTRLKYRQKQVADTLQDTYAKLGAIVYEAKQNGQNFEPLINKAVADITELNKRYDQLEEAIALVGSPAAVHTEEFVFMPTEPAEEENLDEIDCPVCDEENELGEVDFSEDFELPKPEETKISLEMPTENSLKDIELSSETSEVVEDDDTEDIISVDIPDNENNK